MNFVGKASVSDEVLEESNIITSISTIQDQQIRVRDSIELPNNLKINKLVIQTQYENELSEDHTDNIYDSKTCQAVEETSEENNPGENKQSQDINCKQASVVPQLSVLKVTKNEPEQHVGQICGKTFKTSSNLNVVHVRIHSAERKFVCNICEKSYKHSTQLINHKQIHTGEKPFTCYYKNCQKKFTQLGQLKKHVRVHTGERPYECSVCLKRFSRGYHLQTHGKLHTKAGLHVCNLCEKSYTQAPQLRIHMRTHLMTKDFSCSVCRKSFHKISVRNKHMQIHVKT